MNNAPNNGMQGTARGAPPLMPSVRQQLRPFMAEKLVDLKCGYCHEQFQIYSGTRHCYKCGAIFHDTCWFSQPTCATFGCGGNISREEWEKRTNVMIGASYLIAIPSLFIASYFYSRRLAGFGFLLLSTLIVLSNLKPDKSFLFAFLSRGKIAGSEISTIFWALYFLFCAAAFLFAPVR